MMRGPGCSCGTEAGRGEGPEIKESKAHDMKGLTEDQFHDVVRN